MASDLDHLDNSGSDWSPASDASDMLDSFNPGHGDSSNSLAGPAVRVDAMLWPPLIGRDAIRVMVFEPATDVDSPVHFKFEVTSLSTPKAYHTLSYAWGAIEEDGSHLTDYVLIDGLGYKVTQHLNQGLKRIRHHWREISPRPCLWCDALSIDQANAIERSWQVTLMRQIYARAESVLIWLGEPQSWGDNFRDPERYPNTSSVSETANNADWGELPAYVIKSALYTLTLPGRYFQRRWVIQELLLQPHREVLMAGSVCSFRSIQALLAPRKDDYGSYLRRNNNVAHVEEPTKQSLLQNLMRYYGAECSDPRDRVYALLGVSSDDHGIQPDYRKGVVELYIEVASHYASHGQLAAILECASVGLEAIIVKEKDLWLPSWVPDWQVYEGTGGPRQLTQYWNGSVGPDNVLNVEAWVTLCEHDDVFSSHCPVCVALDGPMALGDGQLDQARCPCYLEDSRTWFVLRPVLHNGQEQVPLRVKLEMQNDLLAPPQFYPTVTGEDEALREAEILMAEHVTRRMWLRRWTLRLI
ncbi:hypothetical protein LTR10_008820 [Elasticomyces elasticus]|nr:hypothetical protein LTR10_008820 [Elasticomyces elasticus]KAK4974209.1 hypothetical protein LTR42_004848 [Elasticomyces elasticus]